MLWPTEPDARSPAVPDMSMNAKLVAWAILAAVSGTAACDRSTSVGAAGPQSDAEVSDGGSGGDGDAATPAAELCTMSGGTIGSNLCCSNIISFPDSCAVGACGCGPANATTPIPVCDCPAGACFTPGVGCVGAQGACTQGNDLTCNQDSALLNPRGRCVADNRCVCASGATLSSTGKCL